jgi:Bacterial Ig-like domain
MVVTESSPSAESAGAPTNLAIWIGFSDYPDPGSVGLSSLLLTTGVFRVPETYHVDLANKAVVMTPVGFLDTDLGYTASVLDSLSSLAGCSATATQIAFRTGAGPVDNPPASVPTFADVQPILDTRCAGGCHADDSAGCLPSPMAGLSLCAAEARQALINVTSREVSSLLLVAPGDSARSYLLRKVLPATSGGGPIPGTLGEREPPGAPLTSDQLTMLTAWIDGGALP